MSDDAAFDDRLTAHLVAHQDGASQSVDNGLIPAELRPQLNRAKAVIDAIKALKARDDVSSSTTTERPAVAPPRSIGRFRINRELGSGGFGIVYQAWDPVTEREVALKIPRIEALASGDHRRRFEQEARAAARLDHPNIVTVLDAGVDGVIPFITSVYYPGMTLAAWLRGEHAPVSPDDAASLVKQLADAVAHAHERGVLHRDIKPSNILLVTSSRDHQPLRISEALPKLMDFGLAKLTAEAEDMTHTGMLLGTIRYMPPEQAAGRTKQIGPASDVYALGAVLYELLTGQPPFAADSDLEVLRRIETSEPTKIRSLNRHAARDLETVCLKCLEKEPARRYPTARALADDLGRFLAGETIHAKPASAAQRLWKWTRRNPQLAGFLVIAVAALLGFLGFLTYSNRELAERELAARQYAYSADMRFAQEAWDHALPAEALALLDKYEPTANEQDLRGFEWYFLKSLIETNSEIVAHHPSGVWSLAAADDGDRFATGDREGVVRLWRLSSPGNPRELRGHAAGDINRLAFVPGTDLLISAADDNVRLWNAKTGDPIRALNEHSDWVGALAVSRDGRYFATGGGDGRVLLWNLPDATLQAELYTQPDAVRWIAFHPTRSLLSSGCEQGEVRIWNYLENRPPAELPEGITESTPTPSWRDALFTAPNGDHLWATNQSRLMRWDLRDRDRWRFLGRVFNVDQHILALAQVGEGAWLLMAHAHDFEMTLRPADDIQTVAQRMRGHTGPVRSLAILNSGNSFLSASDDGTVRRWRIGVADLLTRQFSLPSSVFWATLAPTSPLLAIGTHDLDVYVLDTTSNAPPRKLAVVDATINHLAWSADESKLLLVLDTGNACWLNVADGKVAARFDCGPNDNSMFHAPSGKLAVCDGAQTLSLFDAHTGRKLWQYRDREQGIADCRFLTANGLLVTFNAGNVKRLNVATGEVTHQVAHHKQHIFGVDSSSNGSQIVTGSGDKTINILDARTLALQRSFSMPGEVGAVCFVEDDSRLVANVDHHVYMLDAQTGQRLLTLPLTFGRHFWLSPDRSTMIGRGDNEVILLPVKKQALLERISAAQQKRP